MFEEPSAALSGTEKVLPAVPDFPEGLLLGDIGVADLVLDHLSLERPGPGRGFPAPGHEPEDPDREEGEIEDESEEDEPEDSGDHVSNVVLFVRPVNEPYPRKLLGGQEG